MSRQCLALSGESCHLGEPVGFLQLHHGRTSYPKDSEVAGSPCVPLGHLVEILDRERCGL